MKRFYIGEETDSELGTYFSAYEFEGLNKFNEEQWEYVEGTMAYTKAETVEQLQWQRDNVTDKDIELCL